MSNTPESLEVSPEGPSVSQWPTVYPGDWVEHKRGWGTFVIASWGGQHLGMTHRDTGARWNTAPVPYSYNRQGISLGKFCTESGADPADWSVVPKEARK